MLEPPQITSILAGGVERSFSRGQKVLLVVPDATRSGPLARLVRLLVPMLLDAGTRVDVLIALGTHPPMSRNALRQHLGLTPEIARSVRIMNHAWDSPEHLVGVGRLAAERVARLTDGLMTHAIDLTLNRAVREHDHIFIVGPVFPHEIAGFSGGSKYLFPGISGPEMIDETHWLGALVTNLASIGRMDTPVRRVLDAAAASINVPITACCYVVEGSGLAFLAVGDLADTWRAAAAVSASTHVIRMPRTYRRVLACAPARYDDLWTGGKCMYKTEAVVEDGGEIIIHAPHIASVSVTHGAIMERIGYHVRDYFLADMDRFCDIPKAVMAVSTYLKGSGTCIHGVERPRIRVSVASAIPPETCARLGLGFVAPESIDMCAWRDREDEGLLLVEEAGERLYIPETEEKR